MGHASSSHEQVAAEAVILTEVGRALGCELSPGAVELADGVIVRIDGVSSDGLTLVEAFAHQGPLKGGQRGKIARDTLKLITVRRVRPDARAVLAFADEKAASFHSGTSWLAEAIRQWEVDVLVIELPAEVRANVEEAQQRQTMVNAEAS